MKRIKWSWLIKVLLAAVFVFTYMHLSAQDGKYFLNITLEGEEYNLTKGFYRELMQGDAESLTLDPVPAGWIDGSTTYIMASSYTMSSDEMDTILGTGGFMPMFQDEGSFAYITVHGAVASGNVYAGELFFMHITKEYVVMAMCYDLEIRFDSAGDQLEGTFTGTMVGVRGKPQAPGTYLMSPGKGSFLVKREQL